MRGFGANQWRTRDAMMRDLAEMVGERDAIEAFDAVTERDGDLWRYREMSMADFLGIMLRIRRKELGMQSKTDFIESLKPIAEDFAVDFDWDAIADEAGEFDPVVGWRLRDDIAADIDDLGYSNDLNSIIASHDVSTTDESDE